jgi:hypothetical protein
MKFDEAANGRRVASPDDDGHSNNNIASAAAAKTPSSPTCVKSLQSSGKLVESETEETPPMSTRRRLRSHSQQQKQSSSKRPLTRLVSHETEFHKNGCPTPCISSGGEEEEEDDDESAMCEEDDESVEEEGKPVAASCGEHDENKGAAFCKPGVPILPNPLHHAPLLAAHDRALRIESELFPMRQILARLMMHPTHNRRGIFNSPVDPVALGLPDYERIVTKPMDLGTVKARLHAVAYTRRDDVAEDIRLVFQNAMTYNPHDNLVHISARALLAYFEEQYLDLLIRTRVVTVPVVEVEKINAAAAVVGRAHVALRSEGPALPTNNSPRKRKREADKSTEMPSYLDPVNRQLFSSIISANQLPRKRSRKFKREPPAHPNPTSKRAVASIIAFDQFARPPPPKPVEPAPSISQPHVHKLAKPRPTHSCGTCRGRTCAMCKDGCLTHEPALLICTGTACGGVKIRKGATFYVTPDGARQYCQKCFSILGPVLPHERDHGDSVQETQLRYKKDLLKRKNDEDVIEQWLTCVECQASVHRICAMHNEFVHLEDNYRCPSCVVNSVESSTPPKQSAAASESGQMFTFVSGRDSPVAMSELTGEEFVPGRDVLSADLLAECPVSSFMQGKVRLRMAKSGEPNVDRTVSVRIISECDKSFNVPEVVRKHFRMAAADFESHLDATGVPPSLVRYTSKAISLFQKIDGLDVCIFTMYVQEYDGNDDYDDDVDPAAVCQDKRVYIAYLDSVEYFRPRSCRTDVYHEMLVSYLATARARGYESAHIWACPPARGNSFVFWNHPNSQRTPTKERLVAWYHGALSKAIECGVVTDVKSLYESAFHEFLSKVKHEDPESVPTDSFAFDETRPGRMICPPLLDGDFWIEESVRLYNRSLSRYLKSKVGAKETVCAGGEAGFSEHIDSERCPAVQVASLLRNRIMAHPSAEPFLRPVNASLLNLKDYHRIITRPMDLGTVYSRCILGEFDSLGDLVSDMQLVFDNAKRYNPMTHPVHKMAIEVQALFVQELGKLTASWSCHDHFPEDTLPSEKRFADMSMSLDVRLEGTEDVLINQKASLLASTSALEFPDKMESLFVPKQDPIEAESSRDLCVTPPPKASQPMTVKDTIRVKPTLVVKRLDLLTGGPDAVFQSMVGEDVWLLDKKNPIPPKKIGNARKSGRGGRGQATEVPDDMPIFPEDSCAKKRRRQSWLGEQVGRSMRRFRTSFFSCSLRPSLSPTEQEQSKLEDYDSYIASFVALQKKERSPNSPTIKSRIADARHALLEFSQFRNFEFDTLRRAKYSTAMLLYHLHHATAPGMVPLCTSCGESVEDVRWHKIVKCTTGRLAVPPQHEELCSSCFAKHPKQKSFVPLPVSFKG